MVEKRCSNCGEIKEHQAKGLCYHCYKRQWKPPLGICKECKQEKPRHAKGLCNVCYSRIFHAEYYRQKSRERYAGISKGVIEKLPKECLVCGFDKIIELHHLKPKSKGGNSDINNLVILCPNHHKLLHHFDYRDEMLKELKKKGYISD